MREVKHLKPFFLSKYYKIEMFFSFLNKNKILKTMASLSQQQTIPELLEELVPVLTNRVKAYHTLFSLPLIAEQWE